MNVIPEEIRAEVDEIVKELEEYHAKRWHTYGHPSRSELQHAASTIWCMREFVKMRKEVQANDPDRVAKLAREALHQLVAKYKSP